MGIKFNMKIIAALLGALATATPTQLYERVSEVEALSRNDQLDGQMFYQVSQEEALSRNARQYGRGGYGRGGSGSGGCEKRYFYSYFEKRTVCDWHCPRY